MTQPTPPDTIGGQPFENADPDTLGELALAIDRAILRKELAEIDKRDKRDLVALRDRISQALRNQPVVHAPAPVAPHEVRGKRLAAWTGSRRPAVFVLDTTGATEPPETEDEAIRRVEAAEIKVEGTVTLEVDEGPHTYLFENVYFGTNLPNALEWAADQVERLDDPSLQCVCDGCLDRRQNEHLAEFGDEWLTKVREVRGISPDDPGPTDDELRVEVRQGVERKRLRKVAR